MLVVGSSLMVYSSFRFAQAAARRGMPIAAVNLGSATMPSGSSKRNWILLFPKLVGFGSRCRSKAKFELDRNYSAPAQAAG
jgi:hypothetical protein